MPIDPDLPFRAINIAVLTVSDTRGLAEDRSGDTLVARLEGAGHRLADRFIHKCNKVHSVQNSANGEVI